MAGKHSWRSVRYTLDRRYWSVVPLLCPAFIRSHQPGACFVSIELAGPANVRTITAVPNQVFNY